MNSLGTLGEAMDDAFDWITESGHDPKDFDLRTVVQLHYTWRVLGQFYERRAGTFLGLYRDSIDRRPPA
jgi:hypothetical protein